jgi:hypothetical protein
MARRYDEGVSCTLQVLSQAEVAETLPTDRRQINKPRYRHRLSLS